MCMACFVQDVIHIVSLGLFFFPCHQLNTQAFGIHALKMSASKVPGWPSTSLRAYQMTRRQMDLLPGTQSIALVHDSKCRSTRSINVLFYWILAVVWTGLLNFVTTSRVKNDRIWVLGTERNKRVNLNTEQTGDWSAPASLLGWNCALADGSLKTICAERARDVWQDFQHLRKRSKEYCLSGVV